MEKLVVEHSPSLQGEVTISGAKNSVLKLLAASLLCEGSCVIKDVPDLKDVDIMIEVLETLGSNVIYDKEDKTIYTKVIDKTKCVVPYELTAKMRASIVVLGPLLARSKKADVSLPGGCVIGSRPIDLHIKGLKAIGCDVQVIAGSVKGTAENMQGNRIYLDFPSVGATENILMAAVFANGETIIENAAQEPEITDLASFLTKMGAKIYGAGTSTIRVKGVDKLKGIEHRVIPDRIEAGTYMVAAAITKGKILIKNVLTNHLRPMISKLVETGVHIEEYEDSILVDATKGYSGVNITTLPYPGFPTDMQSQFMSMLTVCKGTMTIKETVFENRFMHVNELVRMGANIKIDGGSTAIIQGVSHLEGASVKATDLRAGAALILAGFVAKGTTEIYDIYHIDRGYVEIEKKMQALGANIRRVVY